MDEKLKTAAEALSKEPTTGNWKKFAEALQKSDAKYYRVVFTDKDFTNLEDLSTSYAEVFDSKEGLIAKVPIVERAGAGIKGATIYLKDLLNVNRPLEAKAAKA